MTDRLRYIPELKALAGREVARQCREATPRKRYEFLRSLSRDIREIVECFPTDFIVYCGHECLLDQKIMQYYHQNPDQAQKYIFKSFERDCEKGITRRKIVFRPCSNYYCDGEILDKIIASQHDIYWGMCKDCAKYRLPHYKLMRLFLEIRNYKIY
jgi:hypothetical protein